MDNDTTMAETFSQYILYCTVLAVQHNMLFYFLYCCKLNGFGFWTVDRHWALGNSDGHFTLFHYFIYAIINQLIKQIIDRLVR